MKERTYNIQTECIAITRVNSPLSGILIRDVKIIYVHMLKYVGNATKCNGKYDTEIRKSIGITKVDYEKINKVEDILL